MSQVLWSSDVDVLSGDQATGDNATDSLINEDCRVFSSKELALSRVRFSPVTTSRLSSISSHSEKLSDVKGQTSDSSNPVQVNFHSVNQ